MLMEELEQPSVTERDERPPSVRVMLFFSFEC